MSNKRIVSCAITGAIHVPAMSEYLPITPEEIIKSALEAAEAGAAVVHLHARNPIDGRPSSDLAIYHQIIEGIRKVNPDVILCITTGGSITMPTKERVAVVPEFSPELASLNAGSLSWGLFPVASNPKIKWKYDWEKPTIGKTDVVFKNSFQDLMDFFTVFNENNTLAEIEVFDVGHLYNVKWLQDNGYLKTKPYLQFVMGINGGIRATVKDLLHLKETADILFGVGGYNWSAFGAGKFEYPICLTNLIIGGHCRVGMEDNLNISKGVPAKTNKELVEKMVRLMKELDFEPATPDEAREMLGITKKTY